MPLEICGISHIQQLIDDRQNTEKNSSSAFIWSFITDWNIIRPESKNIKNKSRFFFYFAVPPTHQKKLETGMST